jgi:hypothetical protein
MELDSRSGRRKQENKKTRKQENSYKQGSRLMELQD